ncbi:PIN domain nuclease [Conexibacter stalactiti]|uniref:Ribonuclease VapC n=1 Tax=Conexibacter stalactiti TaxID=1940611 RepID=A0ABU4HLD4_9ACTN|nr:PIN domain nuclease [Conexibacter stalactiti]MDW5594060.1 PIN domain nuclease [Conexibacter stalactiti]MEC5034702.1 PIN domain nuclease [Conexibacter stalactiti]
MATFLADKSALSRGDTRPQVRAVIEPLLVAGEIATCGVVDLELLYSAVSPGAYARLVTGLRALPRIELTEAIFDRALDVQSRLARRSQHRAVSLPDLIVAACAESAGLTVLHYDADFDRIAAITRQPVRWVLPRGSVS